MNVSLKRLIHTAQGWSPAEQAELANYGRLIEARRNGVFRLNDDENAAIDEALAEVEAGLMMDEEAAFADLSKRG